MTTIEDTWFTAEPYIGATIWFTADGRGPYSIYVEEQRAALIAAGIVSVTGGDAYESFRAVLAANVPEGRPRATVFHGCTNDKAIFALYDHAFQRVVDGTFGDLVQQ